MDTILDGTGFASKDSDEALVYCFDYDAESLLAGVALVNSGTFLIEPTVSPADLVDDSPLLLTAAQATTALGRTVAEDDRVVLVRLSGGLVGTVYTIRHRVTTDENPAQTLEKSFRLRIKS